MIRAFFSTIALLFCTTSAVSQADEALHRFGSVDLRHTLTATGVAFTHDGAQVISSSLDGDVIAWDTATGARLADVHAGEAVGAMETSDDGRVLALSRAAGGDAEIIDLRGDEPNVFTVAGSHAAVSRDGTHFAAWTVHERGGVGVTVQDIATRSARGHWSLEEGGTSTFVGFAHDATHLVLGGRFGTTRRELTTRFTAHDISSEARLAIEVPGSLTAATLSSHDALTIFLGASGGDITEKSFHAPDESVRWKAHTRAVSSITSLADGRLLTGSVVGDIALWEPAEGAWSLTWRVRGHLGKTAAIAADVERGVVATAGEDHVVTIRSLASGKPVITPIRHSGRIVSVAQSRDGRTVATGSWTGTLGLWDATTGAHRGFTAVEAGSLNGIGFLADSRVVTAGREGRLGVWETADDMTMVAGVELGVSLTCVAMAPDGESFAAGRADGSVDLWRYADGELDVVRSVDLGRASISALAWAADGEALAVGATSRLAVIDVAGEVVHDAAMKSPITALSWSTDGRRLALGLAARAAAVLDVATWSESARVPSGGGRVQAVALSPNGQQLAVSAAGQVAVFLHELSGSTDTQVERLDGHLGDVTALHWRADVLVSSSSDGTAFAWHP